MRRPLHAPRSLAHQPSLSLSLLSHAHGVSLCAARRLAGERGYLTIDNIKDIYSVSKHPQVIAGKMTKEEALQEFLNSFEGSEGNRDGKVSSAARRSFFSISSLTRHSRLSHTTPLSLHTLPGDP